MDNKSNQDAPAEPTITPQIRMVKPQPAGDDDYFTAYANGVGIAHTFFDFQFHFSEIKVRAADSIDAEIFATIMMSPQHAKVFQMHLNENLGLYEAKFGEIKIPEGLMQAKSEDIPIHTEQANIHQ